MADKAGGGGGVRADGGATDGGPGGNDGGGASYMPCPSDGTACVILPLGDSITQGFLPPQPGMFLGGYRVELFHQALSNSKKITFVGSQTNGPAAVDNQPFPTHHEGHGGFKITGIAGKITDDAIAGITIPISSSSRLVRTTSTGTTVFPRHPTVSWP